MSHLLRRALVCVLVVGLAAGALAKTAAADEIYDVSGGDLYGVYAMNGTFEDSDDYMIVHHVQFGPSEFYTALNPAGFPSAFFPQPSELFLPGTEFFLIGALDGYAEGDDDHVLLSAGDMGDGTINLQFDTDLHSDLVSGVQRLGGSAPIDPMSSLAFWRLLANTEDDVAALAFAATFFDIHVYGISSPLTRLEAESYNFRDGSEDLFGYTTPNFSGSLGGSSLFASWTDAQDNTTHPVPEPASFALVFGALVVGGAVRRRRRRAA